MANSAVKAIVRVKGILMRAIMNIRTNVSIITLSVVRVIRKLRMTMEMLDKSKIIAINQTKKNVINIIRDVSLSIQDASVSPTN